MVTDAPLTLMPTGVLVVFEAAVPDADAVMLVAPEEAILAASNVTDATPLALVNAVADAGVNTTRPLVAANETTALGTAVPLASFSVAVAVTGVPNATELDERPSVRVGEAAVDVEVEVTVDVGSGVVSPGPAPHPQRTVRQKRQVIIDNKGKRKSLLFMIALPILKEAGFFKKIHASLTIVC